MEFRPVQERNDDNCMLAEGAHDVSQRTFTGLSNFASRGGSCWLSLPLTLTVQFITFAEAADLVTRSDEG